jgi:hypothetical protein
MLVHVLTRDQSYVVLRAELIFIYIYIYILGDGSMGLLFQVFDQQSKGRKFPRPKINVLNDGSCNLVTCQCVTSSFGE